MNKVICQKSAFGMDGGEDNQTRIGDKKVTNYLKKQNVFKERDILDYSISWLR